jgi:hypothetical protein
MPEFNAMPESKTAPEFNAVSMDELNQVEGGSISSVLHSVIGEIGRFLSNLNDAINGKHL